MKKENKPRALKMAEFMTGICMNLANENKELRAKMKATKAHKILGAVGFFFCLALSIYFPYWSSFELICGLALLVVGWA